MAIKYTGSLQGSVDKHSLETLTATWLNAYVTFPNIEGGTPKTGLLTDFAKEVHRYPVVMFMHGSSGLNAQIKAFAYWLSDALRIACIVPDSMQTKDRLTYTSPVPAEDYEKIHTMRLEELELAMTEIKKVHWCDGRVIVAGTSEGGVAAARYQATGQMLQEKAKMIFSWSCENNYHVKNHQSHLPDDLPVLNVMSASDKFFSQANCYLDNPKAIGHAGNVLANNKSAEIVLLPGAPHTLINLPQTRDAVAAFLTRVLRA